MLRKVSAPATSSWKTRRLPRCSLRMVMNEESAMAKRTSSGKVVLAGPGLYEVFPLEVDIGGTLELRGVHVDGEEQRVAMERGEEGG